MAKSVNLKEASRVNWRMEDAGNGYPGDEGIKLGCLMRIADATEKAAQKTINAENELRRLSNLNRTKTAEIDHLRRSNNALRGWNDRRKREIEELRKDIDYALTSGKLSDST